MKKYIKYALCVIVSMFLYWVLVISPADVRVSCQKVVDERSESMSTMQGDYLYMECVRRHGLTE